MGSLTDSLPGPDPQQPPDLTVLSRSPTGDEQGFLQGEDWNPRRGNNAECFTACTAPFRSLHRKYAHRGIWFRAIHVVSLRLGRHLLAIFHFGKGM